MNNESKLDLKTAVNLLQNVRYIDENGKVYAEDPNEGSLDLLINMTSGKYGISRKKVKMIFTIADILERNKIITSSDSKKLSKNR